MQKIEIVLHFMRHIVATLVLEGLLAVILGVLVLVYPSLLSVLAGFFFIATGVVFFASAMKVYQYSKFKIEI